MKPAVLVVDMLEEFVRGRLKAKQAEDIVPRLARLLDAARRLGVPVIHVVDTHYPGVDAEFRLWGPHAVAGSPEARIVEELGPKDGDFVVHKRRYDGFVYTDLDLLLRELGVDTVIVTGIHTHICVQQTVMGAFYRGYRIIVPVDCVAAASEEWHRRGLEYMEEFAGAELVNSEELIKRLEHEKKSAITPV